MKTLTTLLVLAFLSCSTVMMAQSAMYYDTNYFTTCEATTNNLTAQPTSQPGLSPPDTALPCATRGLVMRDTIYFTNFSTFAIATVDSMRIDSIYLPAGLCWSTNKRNNMFGTGASGAILISGTPTCPSGIYKIKLVVDVYTSIGSFMAQDGEALAHLRYHLRVSCPSYGCPTIDPADSASAYVPDGTSCSAGVSAAITPGGSTQVCTGIPVTLLANTAPGYTYHWSTGETTSSIQVYSSGSYGLTVYNAAGDSAVAVPVPVSIDTVTAQFTVFPDPSVAHAWLAVNQSSGSNLNYTWIWGDGTVDGSGPAPTHTYDSAGYYTICLFVSDGAGCSDYFCDSSRYLSKTNSQTISFTVVQYPLSVLDANTTPVTVSYYADAVHFSDNITDPSDVSLYDMSGRIVMSRRNWTGSALATDVLADGVYIVSLQNSKRILSGRISIVR